MFRLRRGGAIGQAILAVTGAVQTIPSLALLALLVPVPFFGISPRTAIAALFLYGLLPIVRNTATGLQDIAPPIRESAIALGLEPSARLWKIYLPIASRTILGGIKTSAVINIGTATLAALIGAGGLGEPILSGLNLNDHATILQGAIPAAVLALARAMEFRFAGPGLDSKGLASVGSSTRGRRRDALDNAPKAFGDRSSASRAERRYHADDRWRSHRSIRQPAKR